MDASFALLSLMLAAGADPVRSADLALSRGGAASEVRGGAAEAQPNVVLIDVCSARADHFGLYGYPRPTTPGLDALAKETVVFDRAMAQSSWCLPNYASLFTGNTPEAHGETASVPFKKLPADQTTIAERLGAAGYRTGAFTGGIYFLPAWNMGRGFETFVNEFSTADARPARFAADVLPKIESWLGEPSRRPFFLYAAVDDLHAPYQSDDPDKYDRGYSGVAHDTATLSVGFFRAYNGEPPAEGAPENNLRGQLSSGDVAEGADPMRAVLGRFRSDPRHLAHVVSHYDAALGEVDKGISSLIARLKAAGLWENTLVIVTADHGELLGEHGLLGHTQGLYEPVLHVPLLIHDPRRPGWNGKRSQELVERIDLAPTVLDYAGAAYRPDDMQGRSLVPFLDGARKSHREYAYASSKRNLGRAAGMDIDERVVRDRRWKLHWYRKSGRFELYDLDNDPRETRDVADRHPREALRLSYQMLEFVEDVRPKGPGAPHGLPVEPAEVPLKPSGSAAQ